MSIPHDFLDPSLRELALTHASTEASANNERLEFLGDAVLDLIVAEELFRAHTDLAEGDLTELKAWVVSRRTLAKVAATMGLHELVRVGQGMRNRTLPRSVLANVYEAVLGAVYLDGGLEPARKFALETLREPLARMGNERSAPNPKQELQRLSQRKGGDPPTYEVIEERGSAHAKAFLVQAQMHGRAFPEAWGRTRKEAERWAAHEALLVLAREANEA